VSFCGDAIISWTALKLLSPEALFSAQNAPNIVWRPGSAQLRFPWPLAAAGRKEWREKRRDGTEGRKGRESLAPTKVFRSLRLWLRLVLGHEQWKSFWELSDRRYSKVDVPCFRFTMLQPEDIRVLNVWDISAALWVSLRSGMRKALSICAYTRRLLMGVGSAQRSGYTAMTK